MERAFQVKRNAAFWHKVDSNVLIFLFIVLCGKIVGYNIGVMNSPAEYMKAWCNQTLIDRYNLHLDEDSLVTLWSTIISIFLVGGCIGSLFAATLADKFGRFVILFSQIKIKNHAKEKDFSQTFRFCPF